MADDIKRYKTVRATHYKDLDDAVTKSLESGWQPFGSPYVVNDSEGPVICQAMTSTVGTMGTTPTK
jgi:hypothetical protein